jgi:hypothetical protein
MVFDNGKLADMSVHNFVLMRFEVVKLIQHRFVYSHVSASISPHRQTQTKKAKSA